MHRKFNFHFPSARNEFFCEGPTIYLLQIVPNHFYKILGHIECTIDQMVRCQKFRCTSHGKDKFPPIQEEAGQI